MFLHNKEIKSNRCFQSNVMVSEAREVYKSQIVKVIPQKKKCSEVS